VTVAAVAIGAYLALGRGDRGDPPADPGASSAGTQKPPQPPEQRALLPSPLDGRQRSDVPPRLLALAGGGDRERAAAELVAVLANQGPFILPRWATTHQPAVSLDGKWLAVPCGKDVALFEATTGALRRTLAGASQRLHHVAFAADGKRVGGSCDDGRAYVWEAESGKLELTLGGHGRVHAIAFSLDGKRIATASDDGSLFLWDADGRNRTPLTRQPRGLHTLAFSADGATLASAGDEGVVVLWDTAAGTQKKSLKGHTTGVHNLRWSAEGTTLASGGDREVILWDLETGKPRQTLAASACGLVAFTPDGRRLLAAHWAEERGDYRLTRWDATTGKQAADIVLGPRRKGLGVLRFYAASPDGTTVYACHHGGDDRVSVLDAATGKERFRDAGFHTGPVWAVAVSPDGQTLATGGEDHTIRLWDLAAWKPGTGLPPCRVLQGHSEPVHALVFSPDGHSLASGGSDGIVILWDPATGKKRRDPLGRMSGRGGIAVSPDGNALATGQEDGSVAVAGTRTGEQRADWPAHKDRVRAVAFSPNGQWVASCGGEDVLVTAWATGKAIRRLKGGAHRLAFSPDGATLYAAADGTLRAWATADWHERPVFPGHAENAVGALAVHAGGRLVATGATNGSVVVRDLPTGRARGLAPGGEGEAHRVEALAFTPGGRYLVAASANGSVWVLQTPELPPPAEGPPSPRPIDLLALADATRDTERGRWERREADLVCNGRAYLELPYQPPEEYDLTVRFTLHKKAGVMSVHFPYARNRCGRFGFDFDAGGQLLREWTDRPGSYSAGVLDPNPDVPLSREVRVEVRRTGVRLVDNGVEWCRFWGGGQKAPPGLSGGRDGGLPTLHGSEGNVIYHKVEVTEWSGRGWYPYGPPSP
jgi:WD40 repeat protein